MTTLSIPVRAAAPAISVPWVRELALVTRRNLVVVFRTPIALVPPILISLFFLVIYDSTLGGASAFIPGLGSNSYLGFILPLSIVSAALGGAGIAAQNVVREIESGYFDKLLLTPVRRTTLILGPILAGALILGFQASLIMIAGVLMGLDSATGVLGLLTVAGLTVLIGTGFAGFTVSAALASGNAAATQGASFLFFPLTFLAPTFVPLALLDGWLSTAANLNPITYVLVAMRGTINSGWDGTIIIQALIACLLLGIAMYTLALFALRYRTSRK